MPSEDSLSILLKDDTLTAKKLFAVKNIVTEVKNNIETFVAYALRHRKFIYECIEIALETSIEQLEHQNLQTVAFNICEVVCSDEPVIADLFFESTEGQRRKNSEISESIEDSEESETIQSEAERLFSNDESEDIEKKLEKIPVEIEKNEIAKKSLNILKEMKNETSLGYLYKIWSFLIRNNSNQVIEFFESNRDYFELLMNNLKYPSLSNLLAQIIICEDKNKEYKYEGFKKEIIHRVVTILIDNKSDSELYEGVGILLEEVFNSSKQSYCENFDDFKRQVNYLFSHGVVDKFYNILFENSESSFFNVLKYFELLLTRMCSEVEDALNWRSEYSEAFVKFETEILISNFAELIGLLRKIEKFSSVVKINFVSVLLQIIDTVQFRHLKEKLNFIQIFQNLLTLFSEEKSKGLYKMKLSKLIQKIIDNCSKEDLETFVEKNNDFFTKFYPSIQSINMENSKIYNKNELVGFECQILFQIENKLPGSVDKSSKIHDKNLKRMQKKYETKIANNGSRGSELVNLEEVGAFTFNEIPALRLPESFKINTISTDRKGQQSARGTAEEKKEEEQKVEEKIEKKEEKSEDAAKSVEVGDQKIESSEKKEFKMKMEIPLIKLGASKEKEGKEIAKGESKEIAKEESKEVKEMKEVKKEENKENVQKNDEGPKDNKADSNKQTSQSQQVASYYIKHTQLML